MALQLAIEGLSKTYPNGVQALKNVSLTVPTGMFGLLGPNGAGKSTLMRTIATLQEPDQGKIVFDGLDVLRRPDEVRKVLGYLPQDFGVYPRISAQAMLNHLAILKGVAAEQRKEAVESLLHQTNLWDVRRHKLGTFSGGMRQRFGIAQALLGDPKLIIVDEPTAGLDPTERLRFHNLLSQIGEDKVVILSTHIVDDVSELCSQLAIISKGEVLLSGTPPQAVEAIQGRIWRRTVPRDQLQQYERDFSVVSTQLSAGKTVIHVLSEDHLGEGFEAMEADLKDVYFATLKEAEAESEIAAAV